MKPINPPGSNICGNLDGQTICCQMQSGPEVFIRYCCCILLAAAALMFCFPQLSHAQAASVEAESSLRKTIAAFFGAWNRHAKNAWAEFLAQDIQWVFANANLKKTRESVLTYGSINVRRYDVNFEVTKIKLYDEGTRATVLLRGQLFELPVRDGKYTRV